jgi:hypothetical protein
LWYPETDTISYAAPVLSGVSGLGSVDADSQGGQEVLLTGANFGPLSSSRNVSFGGDPLVGATYGLVSSLCSSLVSVAGYDQFLYVLSFVVRWDRSIRLSPVRLSSSQ